MRCVLRIAWGTGWGNMSKRQEPGKSIARRLTRLAIDTTGNTMMIMGLALIPIIGMVGSAFDMGRAYMVKTRLQQACDSGTLAGRKAMTTKNFDTDTTAKTQATNFFKFNFPDGSFGTTGLLFTARGTSDGQVEADATVTVPMTLMRLFQTPSVTINVDCEAIFEVANTDIMFVLDVTGSMNCATGAGNSDCSLAEATTAKIKALRSAVVSFYGTLSSAITSDARLRIGFMPYSTTVNVGASLDKKYFKSIWQYQSRERVNVGVDTVGSWPAAGSTSPSWSSYSSTTTLQSTASTSANCNATNFPYPDNPSYTTPTSASNTVTTQGATAKTTTFTRTATRYQNLTRTFNSSTNKCEIKGQTSTRTETKNDVNNDTYDWKYQVWTPPQSVYDDYLAGNQVTLAIGDTTTTNGPATNVTLPAWDGCVEERATVATGTLDPIPSGAYDLDIDMIPDQADDTTRWAPAWKELIWWRGNSAVATTDTNKDSTYKRMADLLSTDRNGFVCPKAAQKLKEMTSAEVSGYVNAADFKARGYTYHDVGMIWGARFISPDGIFGSENKEVTSGPGAGKPINRHIIFMTDGMMSPDWDAYGLYGIEKYDKRVTAGDSSVQAARHDARFAAICSAIKEKNITLWVVAYDSTLSTPLSNCASPGKAFTATSDTELDDQFKAIAAKIAELRLQR
jgi:Flp pilus assembly protein TadG